MRLQELYIEDYKVLKDFTLRFDEQSAVSVLIGENGSGKTTVVECLTLIFAELYRQSLVSDLYEKTTFLFKFTIRYRLFRTSSFDNSFSEEFGNGYFDVTISNRKTLSFLVQSDTGDVYDSRDRISEFLQTEGQSIRPVRYLFPANVVVYYSGISSIVEGIVDEYQGQQIKDSLNGEMKANPDLFYFKPENFPALLIGLLSFRYGDIPDLLESEFQIKKIDQFNRIAIKIRRPTWASNTSTNFWGAKGDLANFLAVLRDRTKTDFSDDCITFTILTPSQLSEVWSFYGQEKSLFEYLVTLQANGLIKDEDIQIDLRKHGDLIIPYQRLSEGEKQRLIIIALRELLAAGENSLFLLDEPDAFLHPTWQVKFIELVQAESDPSSQYIIATHSPLLLNHADINRVNVVQLVNGKPSQYIPRYAGRDIATVLYELMGVEERPAEIRSQLTDLFSLIEDEDTTNARELLAQIATIIGYNDPDLTKAQAEIDFIEQLNETNNEG